jgi:hypothetical protein
MANQIEQLTNWLVNRAAQQGLSISQFRNLTMHQVRKNLPPAYRERLTETIFKKSHRLALLELFRDKLDQLKNDTTIRQAIISVFPDATFQVNPRKRQIVIEVQG